MKAFVTGANGFLGSHLADRLIEEGHDVHVLVRKTSNLQWLMGKRVQYHYGDVAGEFKGFREGLEGADLLFHVAGVIRAKKARTYYEVNAQGTANILETCLKVNPKIGRVIVVTSLAAHGPGRNDGPVNEEDECRPITDYGKSKRDAELITLKYADRLPVTIVRPPAIYGPRDDQFFRLFQAMRCGIALLPGWGRRVLNLAHAQDVITGLLLAATSPKAVGEIFFIGEDRNYSWVEAIDMLARAVDRRPVKIHIPGPLVYAIAGVAEGIGQLTGRMPLLNLDYARNFMQRDWTLDISKAKKILGYRSEYSFEKGAKETAMWYEGEGWL